MRLQRGFTNKEWKEISEKYKDGGVHNYRGKRTVFFNGFWPKLGFKEGITARVRDNPYPNPNKYRVFDEEERDSWEMIVIMPGVEIIPHRKFVKLKNLKVVIMADTVKSIKEGAFENCISLVFVKLSRTLEIIGLFSFYRCSSLTSIFIPPSCREIRSWAFAGCKKLLILGLPQQTQFHREVFQRTELMKRSPIRTNKDGEYDEDDDEEAAIQWIRSINNEDAYALHRACSSFNPLPEIIHDIVKQQGIGLMRVKNAISITPSQYLNANPFAEISEREIVNRHILDMMGEIV